MIIYFPFSNYLSKAFLPDGSSVISQNGLSELVTTIDLTGLSILQLKICILYKHKNGILKQPFYRVYP